MIQFRAHDITIYKYINPWPSVRSWREERRTNRQWHSGGMVTEDKEDHWEQGSHKLSQRVHGVTDSQGHHQSGDNMNLGAATLLSQISVIKHKYMLGFNNKLVSFICMTFVGPRSQPVDSDTRVMGARSHRKLWRPPMWERQLGPKWHTTPPTDVCRFWCRLYRAWPFMQIVHQVSQPGTPSERGQYEPWCNNIYQR